VGCTDSELAFCDILERLLHCFPQGCSQPEALYPEILTTAESMRAHGELNFLLSNGDVLFAHCATKLAYLIRQAPFSRAHLVDEDYEVDFSEVTTPKDRVAVIATAPLTDNEAWTVIAPGELLMFRDGAPVNAS
jgi:glutamine amidotransferase